MATESKPGDIDYDDPRMMIALDQALPSGQLVSVKQEEDDPGEEPNLSDYESAEEQNEPLDQYFMDRAKELVDSKHGEGDGGGGTQYEPSVFYGLPPELVVGEVIRK